MYAWGCLHPRFSNNPWRSPVIGHSPSLHSCFVPNKQTSHLSERKGERYYKQLMKPQVVLELVVYIVPGGNTPKIAVAETWPSAFRAMHLYVPESIWLATSICSQLESSYFWGPPRDCRTNGEMKRRGGYWKKKTFPVGLGSLRSICNCWALGMLIETYTLECPVSPESLNRKHLQKIIWHKSRPFITLFQFHTKHLHLKVLYLNWYVGIIAR